MTDYFQRANDLASAGDHELKLVLLLNELRDSVHKNVQVFSIGEFLSVYCAYLQSLFFTIDEAALNASAESGVKAKVSTLNQDFVGLHRLLVEDLRLRRLAYLEPQDIILLLKCYVQSQSCTGPALEFFTVCDKFLGKHSDTLSPQELEAVIYLQEQLATICDTSEHLGTKLLLKLQKHLIAFAEDGQFSINQLASMVRVYAN